MGYYASATGNLSLRESVEDDEKLAEKAKALVDEISRGTDINFDKYNGEYDVSGHDKYHEEDWNALAEYFDGEISFIGEDDTRWKFILKDGKASEVTPIEFWPESSEESYTDTLLKALREKNEFLNPLNVLEKIFPDFIAAKIWRKEDIKTAAEDLMELPTDITSAINLDEAVENLENGCIDVLTEATDEEWGAVKTAVKDTLRKKDAYATDIVWSLDNDDDGSDLPEEIYIPEDIVLSEGDSEAVGNYITDMTGFCHEGYVVELRDKKPETEN